MHASVHACVHPDLNNLFLTTARPISTKVGAWLDTPCKSMNLKNQKDRSLAHVIKRAVRLCPFSFVKKFFTDYNEI